MTGCPDILIAVTSVAKHTKYKVFTVCRFSKFLVFFNYQNSVCVCMYVLAPKIMVNFNDLDSKKGVKRDDFHF